ncbi:DUF1295 domain-containing protein [Mycobacterium arosiense]|uniref:Uncharacterized protein n=1 Tax=Mycobacterium arosiense ATCC BAA-1401 = DSM 45069 TaxID=1265311 RepID=A0A1W9ZBY7_MYCAI|nr:DUF1295 domain-containing protein [Mycobacterium arosiense]ORA11278.1 hypothetical protein BST14_18925 [Mycobacterium arosiense ATCC BAA-1401 = DSM 45069]
MYGFRHGNDLSLIDGYYGFAPLVHVAMTLVLWHDTTPRGLLVTAAVGAWSLGLGYQLSSRWWRVERHRGGDVRYRLTSERIGLGDGAGQLPPGYYCKCYLAVAVPQVLLITILTLPAQLSIMITGVPLGITDGIGLVMIAIGGATEVAANWQLERFKAARRPGQTLMTGLFAWSRHPNYFGNLMVYLGCYVVAISEPALWWTVISPIAILVVLRFVLGVHMTDQLMLEKRRNNAEYLRYVATTPSFVPVPPALRRLAAKAGGRPNDS